jgi:hypothetical protein
MLLRLIYTIQISNQASRSCGVVSRSFHPVSVPMLLTAGIESMHLTTSPPVRYHISVRFAISGPCLQILLGLGSDSHPVELSPCPYSLGLLQPSPPHRHEHWLLQRFNSSTIDSVYGTQLCHLFPAYGLL